MFQRCCLLLGVEQDPRCQMDVSAYELNSWSYGQGLRTVVRHATDDCHSIGDILRVRHGWINV
jgi:hypothetical protein